MIPNLCTFDNIFMGFFSHKCEKSTEMICNFCDIKRHEFNAILSNLHKIRSLVNELRIIETSIQINQNMFFSHILLIIGF